jgi:quercetin dioxygenase-like cupin family protein
MGLLLAGKHSAMISLDPSKLEFSEAWQDGDASARWRSAAGHSPSQGAADSGSSLLEVDPGCRLPRHTDSAEETIVVLSGTAEVQIADERCHVLAGGLALVPKCVPHEVSNAGDRLLRFAAVYAEPEVITRYERDVQPDGSPERKTVS